MPFVHDMPIHRNLRIRAAPRGKSEKVFPNNALKWVKVGVFDNLPVELSRQRFFRNCWVLKILSNEWDKVMTVKIAITYTCYE